jgi:DNA-binding NarL/FixJ family response regulator
MHDELFYAERSLIAGARGYINKSETSVSIVEAIHVGSLAWRSRWQAQMGQVAMQGIA